MGLRFCVEPKLDHFEIIKDLKLFVRSLCLKVLHHKIPSPDTSAPAALNKMSKKEYRTLRGLTLLAEQSAGTGDSATDDSTVDLMDLIDLDSFFLDENPKIPDTTILRKKSSRIPAVSVNASISQFFQKVNDELKNIPTSKTESSNLPASQL